MMENKNEIQNSQNQNPVKSENSKLEKSAKKEKVVKKFPAKKLPSLFKKAYTEKEIEKKLLKKLYVESDKNLIKSLFTEKVQKGKKEKLKTDLTKEYTKSEIKHFKEVAKAIKKNKGRIRLVPLAAVVGFIAAIVIVVGIFKNPVAKKLIISGCENIFGAKTSIKSVNVKLLGITVDIKGLSIGNKDSDNGMKNLFDADITIDADLASALRGKFVSDKISVTNMEFGRERTEKEGSCLLPAKAKKIEKAASKDSTFMKSVQERSNNAIADLRSQIESLLGGSTPDEIWKNLESQIKSKDAAEQLKTDSQALVEKWKAKPDEIKSQVQDLADKVKKYQNLNVQKMTPAEILTTIDDVKKTLSEIESLSKTATSIKDDVDADKKTLENAAKNMTDAIASDKALAENLVNTVKNAGSILTSALDTVGYDMLGKYYPYAKQGINYALQMKNNSSSTSSEKKAKKSSSKAKGKTGRMKGTTFWFSTEKPGVWVKLVEASGTNFKGNIENISSNQDLLGKPLTGNADFTAKEIAHSANLILDARSKTSNPLITLGYTGNGFNADIDGAKIASASGIPSIAGKTKLTLKGTADADQFSASGDISLNPVNLTSDGFGNEKIDKYYQQALSSVKKLALGYKVAFTETDGVNLSLSGNYADVFSNALSSVAASVGADVKAEIQSRIAEKTNEYSSEALAKFTEFTGISTDVDTQVNSIDDMKKILNDKLTELAKQQTEAAKSKAAEAVTEKANEALKNNKAAEEATKAASGLLKGFRK